MRVLAAVLIWNSLFGSQCRTEDRPAVHKKTLARNRERRPWHDPSFHHQHATMNAANDTGSEEPVPLSKPRLNDKEAESDDSSSLTLQKNHQSGENQGEVFPSFCYKRSVTSGTPSFSGAGKLWQYYHFLVGSQACWAEPHWAIFTCLIKTSFYTGCLSLHLCTDWLCGPRGLLFRSSTGSR